MRAKHADNKDAKPVSGNCQGNDKGCQDPLLPRGGEKQVAREQARDEQHEAGSYPTAFLRDAKTDPWKLEDESIAEKGRARPSDEGVGGFRGGVLEKDFESVLGKLRERYQENEEAQREGQLLDPDFSEEPEAACDQEAEKGKR